MKTCGDCIHADICKQVNGGWFSHKNIMDCKCFKDHISLVEVVHGRWIKAECSEKDGNSSCSECGHWDWNDCNYCPNCGAKMNGGNGDGR